MPTLFNSDTGELIAEITDAQLQFLIDNLEEESLEDQEYEIEDMTLAYFQSQGIDPELLKLLQTALSGSEQLIIRWS